MAEVEGAVVTAEEAKPDAAKSEAGEKPALAPREHAARPKPTLDTFTGVDWTKVPEDARAALQAEMDRRVNVARENAARRAKKETETFYKGRESVKPAAAPQQEEKKEPETKVPQRNDIDPQTGEVFTYEAFILAHATHVAERSGTAAYERATKAAAAKAEAEAQAKRAADFEGKVRAKYPDIDDRLAVVVDQPIHKGVQEAITESEFGPEILNNLVSNPQEFDRLYKLSETAAVKEIGRMEARFETPAKTPGAEASETPAEPVKKPSAAPAPIKPGGGGSPEDSTPKDSDDINDWMRKELARKRKKHA